jgi:hypothetical protein
MKEGFNPFDPVKTTVVCRNNYPHVWWNNAWTEVVHWNDRWWPLSGVSRWDLLPKDARSCAKITTVKVPGGQVTTVHTNHGL